MTLSSYTCPIKVSISCSGRMGVRGAVPALSRCSTKAQLFCFSGTLRADWLSMSVCISAYTESLIMAPSGGVLILC